MTPSPSSGRRLGGFITRAAAAGALVAGTVTLAAAPAQAASISGLGPNNVGVTQNIQVTGFAAFCTLEVDLQFNGATVILPPVGQTVVTDANGNATVPWTPMTTGSLTQIGVSGVTTDGQTLCGTPFTQTFTNTNISKVGTSVVVDAPNTATVGQSVRVQATVQSSNSSRYTPTGTITITDANGASLSGPMGLTPGPGAGQAYAYFNFVPKAAGNYYFKAQYGGDAYSNASPVSPLDTMIATPSGNTIAISAPPVMTQGQSVTLTATIYPAGTQGSVGFTINGSPISASIPVNAQGQASMTWTPNVVGNVTLGANYTTNAGGTGSTSQPVTIVAGPAQQDTITLIQPGWGPWTNGGTYTLGNGSNFTFQATSLSGAPVVLSETGPCGLNGNTINVPVGSGQCNLQARTNGGNGYAPVTYGYTIALIPGNQVATVAAPNSGRYKAGRSLVLEAPGQADTNAGQNINWVITKGKNKICKLQYPDNGSVTLKLIKKGHCMVKANAPGVPGQWNPYNIRRSYHAF